MSSFHPIPLLLRTRLILLCFIRNTAVFPLHHIAYVHFVFQHIRNGVIFPQGADFLLCRRFDDSFSPFIFRGIGNTSVIEHSGNGRFPISLGKQRKNFPHNLRRLLINDEVPLSFWVFLIPIQCRSANMKSIFPPIPQNAPNIIGHILQIPFVDQTIDLP